MIEWNLKGKKALVTGGSKGIGKAIVSELLELGAEVVFTARNEENIEDVASRFRKKGHNAFGLTADVVNEAHRRETVDWIEKRWGQLDILVNNAGINIRKSSNEYQVEEYRLVVETDLIAPFAMSRELFHLLEKSGRASVVNIASVAGMLDARTGAPYGMSKSGLIQLTRNLASEWAGSNIRVNAVSPWFTKTPSTSGVLANPEKHNSIVSRTPFGRIAEDREIAGAVAFLLMDKASFITGQNLVVDGGATSSIL